MSIKCYSSGQSIIAFLANMRWPGFPKIARNEPPLTTWLRIYVYNKGGARAERALKINKAGGRRASKHTAPRTPDHPLLRTTAGEAQLPVSRGNPPPCLADTVLDLPISPGRASLDKHSYRLIRNWVGYAFCFFISHPSLSNKRTSDKNISA